MDHFQRRPPSYIKAHPPQHVLAEQPSRLLALLISTIGLLAIEPRQCWLWGYWKSISINVSVKSNTSSGTTSQSCPCHGKSHPTHATSIRNKVAPHLPTSNRDKFHHSLRVCDFVPYNWGVGRRRDNDFAVLDGAKEWLKLWRNMSTGIVLCVRDIDSGERKKLYVSPAEKLA